MASEQLSISEERLGWFIDTMVAGLRSRYEVDETQSVDPRGKTLDALEEYHAFIGWLHETAEHMNDWADLYQPSKESRRWLRDMYDSLDCEGK